MSGERVGKISTHPSGKTLILMMGLPYAGKSTAATRIRGIIRGDVPIVSPDAIRVALYGERFLRPMEGLVWELARKMVRALFYAGHATVIVDATHTRRSERDVWRAEGWESVLIATVEATAETCMQRAQEAGDHEIVPVIERMAARIEAPGEDEPLLPYSIVEARAE